MVDSGIAITVDALEMAYGDFVIQRDLDFAIRTGEIFVIMGDSGSGKSSLLRHLIGLQRPAKGRILYGEDSFWDLAEEERSRFSRRFGVLYQSGALWSSMTIAENVALPLREHTNYSETEISELVSFKLSLVALAGFEGFYPSEISGGMRKRAGLEVRSHEVPFVLEDGQRVGQLIYEKLSAPPVQLYGEGIGSNYQHQGLRLSKHFALNA